MNPLYNIAIVLLLAITVSLISYFIFGVKGPWENFWIKTLLMFLFLMAASLWIRPYGPDWMGVHWAVLIIGALLFILLMAAFTSSAENDNPEIPTRLNLFQRKRFIDQYNDQRKVGLFSMGMLFWLLFIFLIIIILTGYYLS